MADSQAHHYNMKWDNYHSHVGEIFSQLLETGSMADVVLYAEGEKINCHRILLSACSPYFQEILTDAGQNNTVIVVSGISGEDVRAIIEFVYRGEISVRADRFSSVLKAAEALKICGLMEVSNHLADMGVPELFVPTVEMQDAEHRVKINKNVEKSSSPFKNVDKTESAGIAERGGNDGYTSASDRIDSNDGYHENLLMITDDDEIDDKSKIDVRNEYRKTCRLKNAESKDPQSATAMETSGESDIQHIKTEVDLENNVMVMEKMKQSRRKDIRKKTYSEESMLAALEDMKSGKNLVKAASKHNVPRTTLYTRARAIGACPVIPRKGYSREKMMAALQSVVDGSSLQSAATQFGIPKTVLWRRAQKEIGNRVVYSKPRVKGQTSPVQAKPPALEESVSITRVPSQYQSPKATIFRFLVKSEVDFLNEGEDSKPKENQKSTDTSDGCSDRTAPAETADGSSSNNVGDVQIASTSSSTTEKFKMPTKMDRKMTRPRRIEIGAGKSSVSVRSVRANVPSRKSESAASGEDVTVEEMSAVEQLKHFQFSEGVHELPVSYIENPEFTDSSIIILTPVDQCSESKFTEGLQDSLSAQIYVDSSTKNEEIVVPNEIVQTVKVEKE